MVRNMGVARDLGLLRVAPGLMVSLDDAAAMPPEQVVLVSTGSQGEPLSALGRMARGDHHQVTIEAGDTVVLASSLVPGNETAVYKVINGLARLGATVVHKETARVHVSGHAPAGELRTLLNVAKPRYLMPVHGEWRHLRAHAALAEETGMARDRVLLAEDGVVVDLVDGKASIVGSVPIGNVYVDGLNVGDVGEESLQARRILGDEGFVALTVVIEPSTRTIVRPVHLSTRGFSDDPAAFDEVLRAGRGQPQAGAAGRRGRRAPAVADHPADRRQVGVGQAPPPPDDHPDRPRGLTDPAPRRGRAAPRRSQMQLEAFLRRAPGRAGGPASTTSPRRQASPLAGGLRAPPLLGLVSTPRSSSRSGSTRRVTGRRAPRSASRRHPTSPSC